jgi:hypothetical protein
VSTRVLLDAAERPDLFIWNGAIKERALRAWLLAHDLPLPDDLVLLLAATGGGDLFECETILGPYGSVRLGDDLVGANKFMRDRGLPPELVAFHRGACVSAVNRASGEYVTLVQPDWSLLARFTSFESWYRGTLRCEYAGRYGLSGPAG